MSSGFFDICKHIWDIFNKADNNPIIVALIIGWIALIISQLSNWLSYRGRLKDKDKEIEDLVAERNKLQEFIFKEMGIQRLTTKSKSSPNRREGK